MISVIICSGYPDKLEVIKQKVAASIGVPFEIIATNNADEKIGIRRAYNRSASAAQYDILCFMHDDLDLLTPEWGKKVLQHFEDQSLGMTGIAGSRYKSRTLSGWASNLKSADCCYIRQLLPGGGTEQVAIRPAHLANENIIPVKVLEGVFMGMRKKVWQEFNFDEGGLNGFHFYDVDISLRIAQKYKIAVVYDIDMVHHSYGRFADEWVLEAIHFHKNVNKVPLPTAVEAPAEPDPEQLIARSWMLRLRREKVSLSAKMAWLNYTKA
ncbi:glycosyltransferase family protein [Chitinophaga sedimenti]|uniref:glycosyltransferase n=1 Tax=Chitinophaga sedimenti TaxID=2033606 RepID=UPI002004A803|nr:glycosyltransferase [Chitinophaga sedimenti]MCK7555863.1 glycosyltransferase family protein [Chitinophaga sedimenti]